MEELIKILKKHTYYEPTKLKNIAQSDYYVDVKEAYGYPDQLNIIVDALHKILSPETTCVIGNGYGGSFVPVLASRHNLNFCMIRAGPKNHGRNKGRIEHYFPTAKDKVAVLDDVLSTGGSLKETGDVILEETEAKIIGFYVAVKRGELKVKLPAPLKYLVSVEEILT
ncbi:MAG: phosphoribosyltransferase family protein [DPANN group archaeon]|nr:phosphoribosyltransferase family protein [DPANN group archaeon]